jgi:hypothetical protein
VADGPEDDQSPDARANTARFSAVDLGALIQAIGYDPDEVPGPDTSGTGAEASDIL